MSKPNNSIKSIISSLNDRRSESFEKTILSLELIFRQSHISGKASVMDSLRVTKYVLTAHLYILDIYFLIIGMTVIVITSGSIIVPGPEFGPMRPYMIFVGTSVGILTPFIIGILILPFNLLLSVSIPVITAIDTLLSAVLMSLVFPAIAYLFFGDPVFSFEKLFLPMLAIYGFSSGYMMLRVSDYVCYNAYKKRHASDEPASNLPPNKRGPLISISAQDHYVEIVTKNGTHLQRMSMTNAVEAVPEGTGMKIHRSHWVAFNQILSLEEDLGRHFVVLRNGTQKPIAKANIGDLQNFIETRHQK